MQKNPNTKKAYVCLDSRYGKFSSDRKHITWNFENSLIESDNSTNVIGDIKNITDVRLYSVMTPQFASTPQRSAILIEEFAAQSFILPNGRRFHFFGILNNIRDAPIYLGDRNAVTDGSELNNRVGDFTLNNKYELLSGYKFNDGIYRFNYPIKHVDTLTISLSNPTDLVVLPKYSQDNVTWTITDTDTLRLNLTFPEPHGYSGVFTAPSFTLFVDGISIPDMKAQETYINSAEHTVYEIIDAYTISIKLYLTAKAGQLISTIPAGVGLAVPIILPNPIPPVTVRFNSQRLIINLEMDYLPNEIDDKAIVKIPRNRIDGNLRYIYLMLDSTNLYEPESTTSKFTWLLNDKVPTLSKGYINVTNPIHNVVKARLGRMTFNNMTTSFMTNANNRHRFGFGFVEFASQALIIPSGKKFQFIGYSSENEASETLHATITPFNHNRGWFRFREQFNILDRLTLNITDLNTDTAVTVEPAVPTVIAATQSFNIFPFGEFYNCLILPAPLPSYVTTVTLSGFTTDNPVADAALIAAYNTTHTLVQIVDEYYQYPVSLMGATFFAGSAMVPVTITITNPDPKFVGVLELVCEKDPIEKIPMSLQPQYKYSYLLLDTNNIDVNLSTDTKFGWNYIPNTILKPGTVNSTTEIRNLVGMRVFPVTSRFIAPVIESGKSLVNDVSNMGYNFTILIHEFSAQSFIGRNGFKYHFVLYPQLMNPTNIVNNTSFTPANPYFEYTTSGKGNGWFWFRKPITTFSTLTISMGNPFDLIKQSNVTRVLIPIQFIFV